MAVGPLKYCSNTKDFFTEVQKEILTYIYIKGVYWHKMLLISSSTLHLIIRNKTLTFDLPQYESSFSFMHRNNMHTLFTHRVINMH